MQWSKSYHESRSGEMKPVDGHYSSYPANCVTAHQLLVPPCPHCAWGGVPPGPIHTASPRAASRSGPNEEMVQPSRTLPPSEQSLHTDCARFSISSSSRAGDSTLTVIGRVPEEPHLWRRLSRRNMITTGTLGEIGVRLDGESIEYKNLLLVQSAVSFFTHHRATSPTTASSFSHSFQSLFKSFVPTTNQPNFTN